MEQRKEQHWVEELFPPHFTAQDLLAPSVHPQPILVSEQFAATRAKRIEEIYQQGIVKFQEEQKRKRKSKTSVLIVREYDSKPVPSVQQVKGIQSKKDAQSNNSVYNRSDKTIEKGIQEIEDQCIWNAQELAVLRQGMHRKETEHNKTKAQMSILNSEMEELRKNSKKLTEHVDMRETALFNAKQELQIRTIHLKQIIQESFKKDSQLQALEKDLKDKRTTVSSLSKELQQTRLEVQDLKLKNKDLLIDLEKLTMQHEVEKYNLVEKAKEQGGIELKKLQMELDAMKNELKKEIGRI
uniref:Coiled-coil domain containing 160 n=1 Tax=Callorhinchus milii TaxID=7868 RepID=A0A4W3I4C9_CALMI